MEDAGTSEEDDIDSQDSNTPIKITTPAVKASVIPTLKMFSSILNKHTCVIFYVIVGSMIILSVEKNSHPSPWRGR